MVLSTVTKKKKLQRRSKRMEMVCCTFFILNALRLQVKYSFLPLMQEFRLVFTLKCYLNIGCKDSIYGLTSLSLQKKRRRRPLLRRLMHSLWSAQLKRRRWGWIGINMTNLVISLALFNWFCFLSGQNWDKEAEDRGEWRFKRGRCGGLSLYPAICLRHCPTSLVNNIL